MVLPLSEISPLYQGLTHVRVDVEKSMRKDGLLHPITVISRRDILQDLETYRKKCPEVRPNAPYYVYTGNNRYYALLEMGVEAVEAYVATSVAQAKAWEERVHIHPKLYDEEAEKIRKITGGFRP